MEELVLGEREVYARELDGGGRWTVVTLDFLLPAVIMGLELRVFAHHGARFGACLAVELGRVDDAPTGTFGTIAATSNIPEPRTVELLGMLARRTAARATARLPRRPGA